LKEIDIDEDTLLQQQLKNKLLTGTYEEVEVVEKYDCSGLLFMRVVKTKTKDIELSELMNAHKLLQTIKENKINEALLGFKK
jgi:hypothetical protein